MEVDGDDLNEIDSHNISEDDNLGSCGSVDDVKTPDDDTESLNQSLSSPGCGSVLSSLQSPSTSLASPLNLLASPSTPQGISGHSGGGDHQSLFIEASNCGGQLSISQSIKKSLGSLSTNSTIIPAPPPLPPPPPSSSSSSSTHLNAAVAAILSTASTSSSVNCSTYGGQSSSASASVTAASASTRHNKDTLQFDTKISIKPQIAGESSASPSTIASMLITNPRSTEEDIKPIRLTGSQQSPSPLSTMHHLQHQQHQPDLFYERAARNPVGVNPQDINNPLSINQLTKPVYISNPSPLHPSHHHLINMCSPLSPASAGVSLSQQHHRQQQHQSSSSSSPTMTTTATSTSSQQQQSSQSQQQQHHHQRLQQPLHFTSASHLHHQPATHHHHHHHHHHHALALSQHLHLHQSQHGFPVVSPSSSAITTTAIPAAQAAAATHHRAGDDGGAISVT